MIHADKMRLLEVNCPKKRALAACAGPDARVHFEYHARRPQPAYVGEELVVSGRILDRYVSANASICTTRWRCTPPTAGSSPNTPTAPC